MPTPLHLDAFAPWLSHLNHNHRKWFARVIDLALKNDFTLCPNSSLQTILNEGRPLNFRSSDLYIDITRALPTNEYGIRPGILLLNEALDRELTFTVNTPTEVISLAIKTLANEI